MQVNLKGITFRRIKWRAIESSTWAANKLREILYMPDVMRALCFRKIDVINRQATQGCTRASDPFKHHSELVGHFQCHVVELPAPSGYLCKRDIIISKQRTENHVQINIGVFNLHRTNGHPWAVAATGLQCVPLTSPAQARSLQGSSVVSNRSLEYLDA